MRRTAAITQLGAVAGTALVLLTGEGCRRPVTQADAPAVVPVEVIEVAPASLEETTVLTGVLDAIRGVDIVSEVSGRIETIHRDVGHSVRAGAALASLDKKVMREALNQADAALMAAEARYRLAQDDLGRDSTLYATGDIAQAILDGSAMATTAALADLKAARAARELAARSLSEADIRAPFSGVVARRHYDVGSYVAPGMPVFRIVAIDSLRLVLNVAQRHVGRLAPGGMVSMTADAFGEQRIMGRIRSIGPEADAQTRTFPVEVVVANPPGAPLRSGLVVNAALVLGALGERVSVPRETVIRRTGGHYVFVVADSVAEQRPVTLGPLVGDRYVIERGLESGDLVVTSGAQNLQDSTRVAIESARENAPAGEAAQ